MLKMPLTLWYKFFYTLFPQSIAGVKVYYGRGLLFHFSASIISIFLPKIYTKTFMNKD